VGVDGAAVVGELFDEEGLLAAVLVGPAVELGDSEVGEIDVGVLAGTEVGVGVAETEGVSEVGADADGDEGELAEAEADAPEPDPEPLLAALP